MGNQHVVQRSVDAGTRPTIAGILSAAAAICRRSASFKRAAAAFLSNVNLPCLQLIVGILIL